MTTLFIAMTVGAMSLMWMETAPIGELRPSLAAQRFPVFDETIIYHTHVPVKYPKWLNIIVLNKAPTAGHDVTQACHFIVSDGAQAITTTELWKRQIDGYHTFAPGHDWNADSIGVCFLGDLGDKTLSERQFNELMVLVQQLQKHFKIRPERVYLHSELDDRDTPPSGPFVRTFSYRLLQLPSGL